MSEISTVTRMGGELPTKSKSEVGIELIHANTYASILYIPSFTHIILFDIRILIPISFVASKLPYKGFIHVPIQGQLSRK